MKNSEDLVTVWYECPIKSILSRIKGTVGTADRIIAPDTAESRSFTLENTQPNATFRYARDWWETDVEKWIWHDMVCYLTIRENATNLIVIRSEQLAALERFNFEKAWEGLPSEA